MSAFCVRDRMMLDGGLYTEYAIELDGVRGTCATATLHHVNGCSDVVEFTVREDLRGRGLSRRCLKTLRGNFRLTVRRSMILPVSNVGFWERMATDGLVTLVD